MTRLDDEIRSRLRAEAVSSRATEPASAVLRDLQPRLRGARRLRRATIGAMGLVLISTTTVALRVSLADRASTRIRPADESEPSPQIVQRTSEPSTSGGSAVTSDPPASAQTGTSAVATVAPQIPTSSSAPPAPTRPGIDDARPVSSIPGLSPTSNAPPPTVVATPPVDTGAETSTSVAPVAPSWSPYRIDGACGSVDIRFLDNRVELVQVLANPGYAVDVKNDGPEEVEVGLHGGNDECELTARMVGGQLVTTSKGPGSDDD